MKTIIFCEHNSAHGTGDLAKKLMDENEFNVKVESCIGDCGSCSNGPFAMVGNEVLKADNIEDLYKLIKDRVL